MTHAPRLYNVYATAVSVAGVALVVGALGLGPHPLEAAIFAVAASLAVLAPARVRSNVQVSLVTVVVFTAILSGGAAVTVLSSVGAAAGAWIVSSDRKPVRFWFNLGQFALSAVAALAVWNAGDLVGASLEGIASPKGLAFLLLMSLAYTSVNLALIAGVIRASTGESVSSSLAGLFGSAAVLQVVYVFLAVIAHVLVENAPAGLVLMLVPLMVARAGLLGFQEQDQATDRMVKAFVKALEVKDGYTRGHSQRVAELTEKVAAEMGFGFNERRMAGYAALLHDVGKIGVPTAIITKRGPLDDDEFAAIKRHPTVGADMLRDIDFLVPALDVVRHHHERFDGRGYPHGLSGERIPRLARMVAVVDAFDAMTSTRSYRKALPVETALEELDRCSGTQFDPEAVTALRSVIAEEGWELTTEEVTAPVFSRAGQVRALAREVAG